MSTGHHGRKPIWYDPVDLSLDSDDSDDSDAPLPPPLATAATSPHRPGFTARPRMYAFPPPPPESPPPPRHAPGTAAGAGAPTRTSVQSQSFRVYPGSSIIFTPTTTRRSSHSSSSDDVSDSSDTGTDRSGSEMFDTLLAVATAPTGVPCGNSSTSTHASNGATHAVVPSRILKRMSSVTLVEDDAERTSGRRVKPATTIPSAAAATPSTSNSTSSSGAGSSDSEAKSPPATAQRRRSNSTDGDSRPQMPLYDSDGERRSIRNVDSATPILLTRMTQERAHHPTRRRTSVQSPASTAAAAAPTTSSLRSQQQQQTPRNSSNSSAADRTWKRLGASAALALNAGELLPPPSPSLRQLNLTSDASSVAATPQAKNNRVAAATAASKTLLVYQPTCLDHHNDTHQENRERLSVLCGPDGVLHAARFRDLVWANVDALQPARLNDLLRVHSFEYIQHLERACARLADQDAAISVGPLYASASSASLRYSDWLQTDKAKTCYAVTNPPSAGSFDMDSPISKSSYLAARLAAGAVCHAIDRVVRHETQNAFVVVRPPGHHAGPNGCVDSDTFHRRPEMCTCGFCLLNNVAIGAAYAMSTYAPTYYAAQSPSNAQPTAAVATIQRVAIVDFDIHHGNGTEDCVRNLVPHTQQYPLPPSWSPLTFASYKPWRDEQDLENVLFASIHLYDDDHFYPCSGAGPHGSSPELKTHRNIVNLPLDVLGPKYLDERLKLTAKAKKQLMAQASAVFRDTVTQRLLPSLKRFQPDLILLSAGFDGHADDFYYYLSEDDYGWITEQILAVADECCNGRVVSVLEGGYNVVPGKSQRPTTKKSAKNSNFHHAAKLHNREPDDELLAFGSLARSCAAHVTALQHASQGASKR